MEIMRGRDGGKGSIAFQKFSGLRCDIARLFQVRQVSGSSLIAGSRAPEERVCFSDSIPQWHSQGQMEIYARESERECVCQSIH